MKLFATPLSHFSRKVIVVLEELGVACEREYVPDLLSRDPADFGGNPILRVPVLEDRGTLVFESDSCVRYLVDGYDPADTLAVRDASVAHRNALSVVASIMGAEVELILAGRSRSLSGDYFGRSARIIDGCLAWLETHGAAARRGVARDFCYLDIALVCMWEHLRHAGAHEPAASCPWIESVVRSHGSRPSLRGTAPERMEALQWELYPEQRPRE